MFKKSEFKKKVVSLIFGIYFEKSKNFEIGNLY